MNAQAKTGRFMIAWFVAGIAVLPLTEALIFIAISTPGELLRFFDVSDSMLYADNHMAALALCWLINGFCIGYLQKAIVKRFLRVDLGRWKLYSALGALLAGSIAFPCLNGSCVPVQLYGYRFGSDLSLTIESSIVIFLYLTVFAAVQCLALSRLVSVSWRWIAAHAGSLLLVSLASVAEQSLSGAAHFNAGLTLALNVLVVTLATGLVMLRLLSRSRQAAKAARDEWAYQPAPLEPPSAERSVWDEAI